MASVLDELGYKKIGSNIEPTGMELDIEAMHKTKGNKVLCECKAHEEKINSEDIRKFYGNLNIEIEKGVVDEGFFFSTSGFSDNVHRMYHDTAERTKVKMTLFDSDKMVELFRQANLLAPDEVIDSVIKTNTNYGIGKRYVVIYQSALYIAQPYVRNSADIQLATA